MGMVGKAAMGANEFCMGQGKAAELVPGCVSELQQRKVQKRMKRWLSLTT